MSRPWAISVIVVGHIVLAWLAIFVLGFLEEITELDVKGFAVVLVLTLPVSYFLSLIALGGLPLRWSHWRGAALASALLSPLALSALLSIYVTVFGYHG